jgi:hypothetical protein
MRRTTRHRRSRTPKYALGVVSEPAAEEVTPNYKKNRPRNKKGGGQEEPFRSESSYKAQPFSRILIDRDKAYKRVITRTGP